jgi:hypothetical protein
MHPTSGHPRHRSAWGLIARADGSTDILGPSGSLTNTSLAVATAEAGAEPAEAAGKKPK